jgi:hypothetical protein
MGWMTEGLKFESLKGQEFFLLHVVLSDGYRGLLPRGIKRLGREADHSPLASAKVKKMWICTSTPPYNFLA